MTLIQYLFEGQAGFPVTDGTTATKDTIGITTAVSIPAGATIKHKVSAKHQGTYGLEIVTDGANAAQVVMNPVASNNAMSRTTAITIPAVPTAAANNMTLWTLRYASGTSLRLNWLNTGHLQLVKNTGTVDLGAFTPGQQIAVQCWVNVGGGAGTSPANSVLHFKIAAKNGADIAGTAVDQTNADIGTAAIAAGVLGTTAAISQAQTMNFDSDQWNDGLADFIAQVVDQTPAANVVVPISLDSAGSFLAYVNGSAGGTLLANVSDTDTTTVARSSDSPATEDKVRFLLGRLNTGPALVFTIDAVIGGTGSGTYYVRLFDGTTLKQTWSGSYSTASPPPTTFQTDAGVASTFTLDSENKWASLHVEVGWKVP